MELELTVVKALDVVTGTSARGTWSKQEMIFEYKDEFERKVCISFWGDKIQEIASLTPGAKAKISFNIESREYNGRWFTELRGWRVAKAESVPMSVASNSPDMPPIEQVAISGEPTSDLPF